jgi:hypothetical protein
MNTTLQAKIESVSYADTGIYITASCGKVSAFVGISDFEVRVICQNSSHDTFRGSGRGFDSIADALAAYRSPQMQAIIAAADKLNR